MVSAIIEVQWANSAPTQFLSGPPTCSELQAAASTPSKAPIASNTPAATNAMV
jgi:hypothetical protein